jgi:uncharacterized membrane-anchored protein
MNPDLHRRFGLCLVISVVLFISAVAAWTAAEILTFGLISLAMLAAVLATITYIRIKLDL